MKMQKKKLQKGKGVYRGKKKQRGGDVFKGRKKQRGGLYAPHPYYFGSPPIYGQFQRGGSAISKKVGKKLLTEIVKGTKMFNKMTGPIKKKISNKISQVGKGRVQPLEYYHIR